MQRSHVTDHTMSGTSSRSQNRGTGSTIRRNFHLGSDSARIYWGHWFRSEFQNAHGRSDCVTKCSIPIGLRIAARQGRTYRLQYMRKASVRAGLRDCATRHASVIDFLITREGPSDIRFCINPDDGHKLLAESAFRVMNKELRSNICNMHSSSV